VMGVTAFVGCWALLQFGAGVAASDALGWAVVPLSVVLALGGSWAEHARRRGEQSESRSPGGVDQANGKRVVQKQRATKNAKQLQVGRDIRTTKKDD
jgi:hypothetical protein